MKYDYLISKPESSSYQVKSGEIESLDKDLELYCPKELKYFLKCWLRDHKGSEYNINRIKIKKRRMHALRFF